MIKGPTKIRNLSFYLIIEKLIKCCLYLIKTTLKFINLISDNYIYGLSNNHNLLIKTKRIRFYIQMIKKYLNLHFFLNYSCHIKFSILKFKILLYIELSTTFG